MISYTSLPTSSLANLLSTISRHARRQQTVTRRDRSSMTSSIRANRSVGRGGDQGGCPGRRRGGGRAGSRRGGRAFSTKGGQGCRQGNRGMEGSCAVVSGVWKKCENLQKKKVVKFFRTGILEGGLRPKKKKGRQIFRPAPPETNFSLRPCGGAKFISSPWAQKWLATALRAKLDSYNRLH
jgi:hypothetical protein